MEPPFDVLSGVVSTTSGYTGGRLENPSYEQVSSGRTGHAEASRERVTARLGVTIHTEIVDAGSFYLRRDGLCRAKLSGMMKVGIDTSGYPPQGVGGQ